jgi:methylglyoxal synthase
LIFPAGRSKGVAMKTIAIIAHDGKKAEMVAFTKDHLEILKKYKIVATGSTGGYIEKAGL